MYLVQILKSRAKICLALNYVESGMTIFLKLSLKTLTQGFVLRLLKKQIQHIAWSILCLFVGNTLFARNLLNMCLITVLFQFDIALDKLKQEDASYQYSIKESLFI